MEQPGSHHWPEVLCKLSRLEKAARFTETGGTGLRARADDYLRFELPSRLRDG